MDIYIYIYVSDGMDMYLGLVYVLLEDTFHSSPFYSRFPEPHSERQNNPLHFQG